MSGNFDVAPCGKLATSDSLLERAFARICVFTIDQIECCSFPGEHHPIPKTIHPDLVEGIANNVALVRDMKVHLGVGDDCFINQTWFADLLARRGKWAECGL